jgi:YidC/Oxa1 family membrane protein insertase
MDINKRSILWIVFAVSLVILWNNWMISTGKPSMFAPAPA